MKNNMFKTSLTTILMVLLFSQVQASDILIGRVIKVKDGDTIAILDKSLNRHNIRLFGIDTPEKKQAYGREARIFLDRLILGKEVKIISIKKGVYGRIIGLVFLNGEKSLNEIMVQEGFAWVYNQYCKKPICMKWRVLEAKNRVNKIGLFRNTKAKAPWLYRKERKKRK